MRPWVSVLGALHFTTLQHHRLKLSTRLCHAVQSEVLLCIVSSASLIDLHTHTHQLADLTWSRSKDRCRKILMCLTIVQLVSGQTAESWQSLCSRKQALLTRPAREAGPPCGRASIPVIPVPPCGPFQANPSSGSSHACPCSSL